MGANAVANEFSQSCKMRNAIILGLEWVSKVEILFITNQGLELYQVNSEKENVKLLKTYNLSIIWFVYYVSIATTILFHLYQFYFSRSVEC